MPIQRLSRDISLTPDLARFVDERVASGHYGTASEIIRSGQRLVEQAKSETVRPSPPRADPIARRAQR
jgi:putative addiction module CopG family antidote